MLNTLSFSQFSQNGWYWCSFFPFLFQMPQNYFLLFFCRTWSIGLSVCPSIMSSHISKNHCCESVFLSFHNVISYFQGPLFESIFLSILLSWHPIISKSSCFYMSLFPFIHSVLLSFCYSVFLSMFHNSIAIDFGFL